MFGISKRQKQVFDAIESLQRENGFCPSYDEIMARSNTKSKSEIYRIVKLLEQRGYLKRLPGQARSLKINEGVQHDDDSTSS